MRTRRVGLSVSQLRYPVLITQAMRNLHGFFVPFGMKSHVRFYSSDKPDAVREQLLRLHSWINDVIEYIKDGRIDPVSLPHTLASKYDVTKRSVILRMSSVLSQVADSNLNTEYAADWIEIINLFCDHELADSYLDMLEDMLQEHIIKLQCQEKLILRSDGMYEFDKLDPKKHKILSSFFYQWAQENGFKKIVKVAEDMSPDDFLKVIQSRVFFKEIAPGFAKSHGTWAHAIQLFIVFMHYQHSGRILHHPLDSYGELGNDNKPGDSLWGFLFDDVNAANFNSPEYVTKLLSQFTYNHDIDQRWPLLSGSIKRTQRKMDKSEVVLKKKYGDRYQSGIITVDVEHYSQRNKQESNSTNPQLLTAIREHHADSVFVSDWMAINAFLHNKNLIEYYLNQLENELQNHAYKTGVDSELTLRDDGMLEFRDDDDKKHKILSSYLYQWAIENGFENIVKLSNVLGNKKFFGVLNHLSFFKEIVPGFTQDHGVWTHALQWYLVMMYYKQTYFLSHHPLAIYHDLGNKEQYANKKTPVWNVLFDNRIGTGFDNPVLLTTQLTSDSIMQNDMKRPLLTGTLRRAQMKYNKLKSDILNKYGDDAAAGIVKRKM